MISERGLVLTRPVTPSYCPIDSSFLISYAFQLFASLVPSIIPVFRFLHLTFPVTLRLFAGSPTLCKLVEDFS